jgi:hypothetical protein
MITYFVTKSSVAHNFVVNFAIRAYDFRSRAAADQTIACVARPDRDLSEKS